MRVLGATSQVGVKMSELNKFFGPQQVIDVSRALITKTHGIKVARGKIFTKKKKTIIKIKPEKIPKPLSPEIQQQAVALK